MCPNSASDNLWLKFELFWEQQGGNESVLDSRPSQVAWGFEKHAFDLRSSNVLRDVKKTKKKKNTLQREQTDHVCLFHVCHLLGVIAAIDMTGTQYFLPLVTEAASLYCCRLFHSHSSLTYAEFGRQPRAGYSFVSVWTHKDDWRVCCAAHSSIWGGAGQGIISSLKRVWLRVTGVILIASTQVMCKLLKQRRPEGPLWILKDGSCLSLPFHKVYFIQKLQPSLSLTLAVLCNLVVMVLCVQQVRESLC